MRWGLDVQTTPEGVRWHLRSFRIPYFPGMGIYVWERSGSLDISPDTHADAASVIAAALREVLELLGDREDLDVGSG